MLYSIGLFIRFFGLKGGENQCLQLVPVRHSNQCQRSRQEFPIQKTGDGVLAVCSLECGMLDLKTETSRHFSLQGV